MRKGKMDEMEQAISVQSAMCAYRFMMIVLGIWMVGAMLMQQKWGIPLYILLAQAVVRFVSKQISRHQVGDERGKQYLIYFVMMIAILLFIVFFVLPMSLVGVRME